MRPLPIGVQRGSQGSALAPRAKPTAIAKAIGPRLAATRIVASPIEATSSQRRATIAIESGHEGAPARKRLGKEERRNRIRTGLGGRANPPGNYGKRPR
jgi:hypothetical protein